MRPHHPSEGVEHLFRVRSAEGRDRRLVGEHHAGARMPQDGSQIAGCLQRHRRSDGHRNSTGPQTSEERRDEVQAGLEHARDGLSALGALRHRHS